MVRIQPPQPNFSRRKKQAIINYKKVFIQFKKIIAVLLAVCLLVSLGATTVYAADTYTLSGDWVFNDTLSDSDFSSDYPEQEVTYTATVTYNGASTAIEFTLMEYTGSVLIYRGYVDEAWISYIVWTAVDGWVDDGYKTVSFDNITVSGSYYTWFTTNATQQIEEESTVTLPAGTYRFNDVPTFFLSSADISFTTPVLDVSGVTLYIQGTRIFNYDNSGAKIWYAGVLRSSYPDYDNMSLETEAYTLDEGWNRLSNTLNLNSEGYGQTITILENAEVGAEFYSWFTANAEPVSDDTTDDGTTGDGTTDTGDTGDIGSGDSGSGDTGDSSGSSTDYTEHHLTIIEWLETIWQTIVNGFESVLSKLEELVGLSADSPSESALKDSVSGVVDTVTDFYSDDDSDSGSSSSSGSGGSLKVNSDNVGEVKEVMGQVGSMMDTGYSIGDMFEAMQDGAIVGWFTAECAADLDTTGYVSAVDDEDPFNMWVYFQQFEILNSVRGE